MPKSPLNPTDLLLYLCTDRLIARGRPIAEAVDQAIAGGVTLVQLREKDAPTREFYEVALADQAVTRRRGVPLVVNDRIDIALAIGAEGLHIGPSDLPPAVARKILGPDVFIGVSVNTVPGALAAQDDGADYLGVGAVFPTGSKADAGAAIGLERLAEVVRGADIPVVGIGGITAANAASVTATGAAGVSLISAILGAEDIAGAATSFRAALAGAPTGTAAGTAAGTEG
jgi:thiamine-phosphate pyrophosphorylase